MLHRFEICHKLLRSVQGDSEWPYSRLCLVHANKHRSMGEGVDVSALEAVAGRGGTQTQLYQPRFRFLFRLAHLLPEICGFHLGV